MARYRKKYAPNRSIDFVIPLLALLLIGIMYLITARSQSTVGFILLSAAAVLAIYWVRELKIMSRGEDSRTPLMKREQRDWIYDLIKNNEQELIFVAEVPGPEDQINVRLSSGVLRIKGGQNFLKDVPLQVTTEMGISDYKYRNGVLTIKIQRV